jgi:hypothetical protein
MQNIDCEKLQQICTEFINDENTMIGMQNNWHDMQVKEIPVSLDKQRIMQALETTEDKYHVSVFDEYINDSVDVYVAISNENISIATKDWLLW